MPRSFTLPVLAATLAIAITAVMDANGLSMFSALPLVALTAVFWALDRCPRAEIGLRWGRPRFHALALAYVAGVLGTLAVAAWAVGATDPSATEWSTVGLNLLAGTTIGPVMVLLTEEGFFRGWLWASLVRRGVTPRATLVITSVVFALWHVSAVTLETGFNPPPAQVPVYLVTATALGFIWGAFRLASGSVVVASVCHAVWNAFAYGLFGFGAESGALGVARTDLFGPEVGLLGMLLNGVVAVVLWMRLVPAKPSRTDNLSRR